MTSDNSNSNSGGSSNPSTDPTGSSNGTGPTDGSTAPSAGSSTPTDGLTTNLKQISDSAKPDLKLSHETVARYLQPIETFRNALLGHFYEMVAIPPLGNPGGLASANQTAANLTLDVNGPGGVLEMVNKYLAYLSDFEDLVKKVGNEMIKSG